ncbi:MULTISPECIES: hypothetical protein [unclassified Chryseobacterium]|uniref:hypothetical protein n=1 Tax=unclassified Chryseobacterium TaxID=2593645 RepID=UPI001158FF3A|nr:hypothetical protein [Chryseobacterium sp. ON_d1]GEJ46363.1 hypothetical protein CRS_29710 [Chryseobacterium sp. ON_d1]
MKKFLLTTIMLVGLSALSKAQQGRVGINTTTPATTLDVTANTADTSKPDALLVPRLTRAQLLAKDAAYTADQNGALTFVTTIDGTATPKTTNVITTGFYYYDAPNSVWKGVGGGSSTPNFQIQKGRLHSANAPIVWAADDYSVVTTAMGGTSQLLLPNATTLPLNSVRCVSSNGPGNVGWDPAAVPGTTRPINNLPSTITSGGSFCFIIVDQAGTNVWAMLSGR